MNLPDYLRSLGACPEAREWAAGYSTLAEAWTACERADWLLWYSGRRGVDRKILVRAACACARTVLPYVPVGEDRPHRAIEMAERWCDGRATLQEVGAYAADAYAAYAAADAAYAYAAYAAAAAAYAAAAYADAYAADAADAAYAAADADARSKAHLKMCVLVRALIPCPSEP